MSTQPLQFKKIRYEDTAHQYICDSQSIYYNSYLCRQMQALGLLASGRLVSGLPV